MVHGDRAPIAEDTKAMAAIVRAAGDILKETDMTTELPNGKGAGLTRRSVNSVQAMYGVQTATKNFQRTRLAEGLKKACHLDAGTANHAMRNTVRSQHSPPLIAPRPPLSAVCIIPKPLVQSA
jgi:hypothetical protein